MSQISQNTVHKVKSLFDLLGFLKSLDPHLLSSQEAFSNQTVVNLSINIAKTIKLPKFTTKDFPGVG